MIDSPASEPAPEPSPEPALAPSPETATATATATATPTVARRRWRWWAAGGLAVLVAAGAALFVAWPSGTAAPAATPSSAAAAVEAPPATLPRPAAGAPNSARQEWVTQEVKAAFERQSKALIAGNLTAYTAEAIPAARAEAGRWFRNLRAMRVTRFDQKIDGQPWTPAAKGGDWKVVTITDHCFVEPDCELDEAVYDTMWRETPQGLRLAGFRVHPLKEHCLRCQPPYLALTRPWQTTELAVRIGPRTLVAVPLKSRNRLADVSRRAEAAAAIADRYVVGEGRVDRYRVFVADPAGWKRWYAGYPGDWVAGQAVATGRARVEVTVIGSQLTAGYADQLLRHELAHVSTLRTNATYGQDDVWWLVEGMADYVQIHGGKVSPTAERAGLHRYLSRHPLKSVGVLPPASSASLSDAAGRYAVGYFALDHLMTKYGKGKALDFFRQAVQLGIGLDTASQSAFGKPWSAVDKECAAALRRV